MVRGRKKTDRYGRAGYPEKEYIYIYIYIYMYKMIESCLYRKGFSLPLLKCLDEVSKERVIQEVHEGVCRNHIGGRSLAVKIVRVGFYWPTLRVICLEYVRKCDRCQKHAIDIKVPAERLYSLVAPWPFFR